jgi:hypothetical protein
MDEDELKERVERYATEVIMAIGRVTEKHFPGVFSEEVDDFEEVVEEPEGDIPPEDEEATETDVPQVQEVRNPLDVPVDEDRPEEE